MVGHICRFVSYNFGLSEILPIGGIVILLYGLVVYGECSDRFIEIFQCSCLRERVWDYLSGCWLALELEG